MENPNTVRLVAKVVRELLKAQSFTCESDLREALKTRCARLHLTAQGTRGYNELVDRAIALVATNTRVVSEAVQRRQAVARREDGRPLTRVEASALLAQLQARVPLGGPRSMDARRSA